MKIAVFGAGNQDLYVNQLKLPEKYGGEPPYGGSRMAIEFAEAGHEVYLSEPNHETLTSDQWKTVRSSGVSVSEIDTETAKNAEIAILFTPFGKKTFNIAKDIVDHLPEDGIIANTCTVSPMVLYYVLERELKRSNKNLGVSSIHPAAVPGTPQHKHYIVGAQPTNGINLASSSQIKKCETLVTSTGKQVYTVPADISSAVADMGSIVTAVTLAGVLEYFNTGTKIIKAPKEMVEKQILMTLQTMASLVESSGVEGMLKAMDPDLIVRSATSMGLLEKQTNLDCAVKTLGNIDPELLRSSSEVKIKKTDLVAAQALTKELKSLMGEKASEGTIKRCMKKMFE
jgi:H2-forming N(5),N(10)-methenyltetrahydromethanopterin dehydrogenase-like protein